MVLASVLVLAHVLVLTPVMVLAHVMVLARVIVLACVMSLLRWSLKVKRPKRPLESRALEGTRDFYYL